MTNANGKQSQTGRAARAVQEATAKAEEKAHTNAGTAAGKAESAGRATGSAAKAGGEATARTAAAAGSGITRALKNVEAGREAVSAATGQVAQTAHTAWIALKHRKVIVAGAAVGVTALGVTSFAAGRRTERNRLGPVTRWTGGRF